MVGFQKNLEIYNHSDGNYRKVENNILNDISFAVNITQNIHFIIKDNIRNLTFQRFILPHETFPDFYSLKLLLFDKFYNNINILYYDIQLHDHHVTLILNSNLINCSFDIQMKNRNQIQNQIQKQKQKHINPFDNPFVIQNQNQNQNQNQIQIEIQIEIQRQIEIQKEIEIEIQKEIEINEIVDSFLKNGV